MDTIRRRAPAASIAERIANQQSFPAGAGDPMTAVAAAAVPGTSTRMRRELAVGVAVAGAIIATFAVAPIRADSLEAAWLEAAARLMVVGVLTVVGLYAWRRSPFNRFGAILVASGVLWLVASFSLSDRALPYSIGRVAASVGWAAVLYLVLAFPEGRVHDRVDRALARATGIVLAVLWLPMALFLDRFPTPAQWVNCSANCPRNALMVVGHEPAVVAHVVVPAREVITAMLFAAVIARLVQRIDASSRIRRRTLTPVYAAAVAVIGVNAGGLLLRRLAPGSSLLPIAAWLDAFPLPAMAVAFLVGLMGWELYLGASLRRFAAGLRSTTDPESVQAAFAEAFEDPSLAIVYPVDDRRWAAADGQPVDAPRAGDGRSVTDLRDAGGNAVATLVHDDALRDETAFINAVVAYATLSLENHRLAAEVASLAGQMRQTQARAAASADRTRQEIERDLHDGAQQRLIALRIKLQVAAERADDPAAGTADQLDKLGDEVQRAIDEMRAMAHGVFPPALTDFGPVEALRETVRSAPIPTIVSGAIGRYSSAIERAVYFCCLEALQNTYKHATTATAARVAIGIHRRRLVFEISDDGPGFDPVRITAGVGLQNMRDRVASLRGSLTTESSPGRGTRVAGEIPLDLASRAGAWPR